MSVSKEQSLKDLSGGGDDHIYYFSLVEGRYLPNTEGQQHKPQRAPRF